MYTVLKAAPRRRWVLASLLLAGSAAVQPAFAACQANSIKVSPNNQNNVAEYGAAPGFPRTTVNLGLSKNLATEGATATWAQTGGPAVVNFNASNPQNPTFQTPDVPNAGATLTFQATITCIGGGTATDTGTVSIVNVNRPPVAIGTASPAIVYAGDTVSLVGTGSSDPDSDSLTYAWTRTSGPAVTLTGELDRCRWAMYVTQCP